MTLSRKHLVLVLLFSLGAFLVSFSAASAQLTTGCPQTCTKDQKCYQISNSAGQTAKVCMTPEEYGRRSTSGTGFVNPGPGTGIQPGVPGSAPNKGVTLVNPLKVNSVDGLLNLILAAAINIGTIILVLALIWVGFLFVAARGSEENLRKAKAAFFWTIIGGLILLGARGLAEVVKSTATTLGA